MAKSPTYNKAAVDKQLTKNGVVKSKAKKLTHKIMKGHQKTDEATLAENLDIVNFSMYAGMYSDGAHAVFQGRDGKRHKLQATGDRPRKYYLDGNEISWDELKDLAGGVRIQPQQGMMPDYDADKWAVNEEMVDTTNEAVRKMTLNSKTAIIGTFAKAKGVKLIAKQTSLGTYDIFLYNAYDKEGNIIRRGSNPKDMAILTSPKIYPRGFLAKSGEVILDQDAIDNLDKTMGGGKSGFAVQAYNGKSDKRYVSPVKPTREKAEELVNKMAEKTMRNIYTGKQDPIYTSVKIVQVKDGSVVADEEPVNEISSDLASRYKKNAQVDRDINDDMMGRDAETNKEMQRRNSKRTAGINRANKRIGEAATEAGLDDNKPIIVKGVKGMKSTAFTKKFRNMAAYDKWTDSDAFGDYDVQQIMNEGAPTTAAAASKRNQAAKERNMRRAKAMMKKGFSAEQAAKEHDLKPSDLKESKMNKTKINEGVLDDMDDDGFMAKRQLYDLAKYSVELHRMIQDTDNLEPWVQAKITKAADYIDTVKHYMEYQGVRDSEEATVDFGMDDIADVEDTLDTMGPEQPMEEADDGMDDPYWEGQDAYRMMDDINPYPDGSPEAKEWDEGYNHAAGEASMFEDEFDVFESEAKNIYKKMLGGLKGKK